MIPEFPVGTSRLCASFVDLLKIFVWKLPVFFDCCVQTITSNQISLSYNFVCNCFVLEMFWAGDEHLLLCIVRTWDMQQTKMQNKTKSTIGIEFNSMALDHLGDVCSWITLRLLYYRLKFEIHILFVLSVSFWFYHYWEKKFTCMMDWRVCWKSAKTGSGPLSPLTFSNIWFQIFDFFATIVTLDPVSYYVAVLN